MDIRAIRHQFVQALSYQTEEPVLKAIRDVIPAISLYPNAKKFKEALSRKASLFFVARYAITMIGLGALLIPFRLLATYLGESAIKTQAVHCSLSKNVPNVKAQPIPGWHAAFVGSQGYCNSKDAENRTSKDNLQPEIPKPIDSTAPCTIKIKNPLRKISNPLDNLHVIDDKQKSTAGLKANEIQTDIKDKQELSTLPKEDSTLHPGSSLTELMNPPKESDLIEDNQEKVFPSCHPAESPCTEIHSIPKNVTDPAHPLNLTETTSMKVKKPITKQNALQYIARKNASISSTTVKSSTHKSSRNEDKRVDPNLPTQ